MYTGNQPGWRILWANLVVQSLYCDILLYIKSLV
jgi:hypothetical protein